MCRPQTGSRIKTSQYPQAQRNMSVNVSCMAHIPIGGGGRYWMGYTDPVAFNVPIF